MKLLDQLRHALRVKHRSWNTEKSYVDWVRQYIRFHGVRHPNEMGEAEMEQFLTHLAVHRHVAADKDLREGFGAVELPYAFAAKIPSGREPRTHWSVSSPRRVLQAFGRRTFG